MNPINTTKLNQLMKEEKWDEVSKMLHEFFAGDLSQVEKGAVYTQMMRAYMKMMNSINRQYIQVLNDGIQALQGMDSVVKKAKDKIQLMKLEDKIKKTS